MIAGRFQSGFRLWPLTTLIGVLLAGLLCVLEVSTRVHDVYRNLADRKTAKQEISSAKHWQSELARLQIQKNEVIKKLEAIYASPAGSDRFSAVLSMLEENAEAVGVNIDEVRPGERVAQNGYDVFPLEISLTGSFEQVYEFTNWIERSRQLVHVGGFDLAPVQPLSPMLTATLQLNALILGGKL